MMDNLKLTSNTQRNSKYGRKAREETDSLHDASNYASSQDCIDITVSENSTMSLAPRGKKPADDLDLSEQREEYM